MVYSKNLSYSNPKKNEKADTIVWKHGSFQEFVDTGGETIGDFGQSKYSNFDIHKIGILDIRIINMDRNDGNILVRKKDPYTFRPS